MEQTQRSRLLEKTRVRNILAACIVPLLGANRLSIVGRRGNTFTRENGVQVRIFNVQAFANDADAVEAQGHWREGAKLENAGDAQAAQQHYKNALNKMMSFSVREENAEQYERAFEVNCRIEMVDNRDKTAKVMAINDVRPVQVEAKGANVSALFTEEEPDTTVVTPATETPEPKAQNQGNNQTRKPIGDLQGKS